MFDVLQYILNMPTRLGIFVIDTVQSVLSVVLNGILRWSYAVGDFCIFFAKVIVIIVTHPPRMRHIIDQMMIIGVQSSIIIILTGFSTGLALALQAYIGLHRFGIDNLMSTVVVLGMTRELGPVLTGIMVTGRCGSAIAAELGSMKVTEQIDALYTLRIDPMRYLVAPRMIASSIMLPLLSLFSTAFGIAGGYMLSVYGFGINSELYQMGMREHVVLGDIMGGLFKATCFGFIMAWVSTYCGYATQGGARGVGLATTRSVVIGSSMILIANYFLSAFLFESGLA